MNWFNAFSLYISWRIVSGKKSSTRSSVLTKIIRIANECVLLGNFNGAFELISATTITPVHRLKKTWGLLSRQDLKLHSDLLAYISSSGNFKFLREKITASKSPHIPYIGLIFKDLTYVDDINQDFLNDKINFHKRRLIANLIRELQNAVQINSYNLTVVDDLVSKLKQIPSQNETDEKGLAKLSFEVEPK
jgi:son of sevenless-like protein